MRRYCIERRRGTSHDCLPLQNEVQAPQQWTVFRDNHVQAGAQQLGQCRGDRQHVDRWRWWEHVALCAGFANKNVTNTNFHSIHRCYNKSAPFPPILNKTHFSRCWRWWVCPFRRLKSLSFPISIPVDEIDISVKFTKREIQIFSGGSSEYQFGHQFEIHRIDRLQIGGDVEFVEEVALRYKQWKHLAGIFFAPIFRSSQSSLMSLIASRAAEGFISHLSCGKSKLWHFPFSHAQVYNVGNKRAAP